MSQLRAIYAERIARAATIATPGARAAMVNSIIATMRKDLRIPHLTLCAFLQDHAKLIKGESK